jgi:dipeptidyl aminopeptidase/acylaminoacyl peptidase
MDLPDGTPRRVATPGVAGHQHQPVWSPDGRDLAFVSWEDETGGHLWRVAADGRSAPRRLTSVAALYREPAWSPDGARIVAIRAAARDVQENLGSFNGGGWRSSLSGCRLVGAMLRSMGPTQGRGGLHFAGSSDRIYASSGGAGLVSFRWDGTDERSHVIVTGPTTPGGGTAPRANRIFLSPDGVHALAILELDLYVVTVPQIGSQAPTISVANPDNAAFPVRRLTDEIGGQFARWSADGKRVHWTIGRTHMVYDLAEADAMREAARVAAREAARAAAAPATDTDAPADDEDAAEDAAPETPAELSPSGSGDRGRGRA